MKTRNGSWKQENNLESSLLTWKHHYQLVDGQFISGKSELAWKHINNSDVMFPR